MKDRVEKEKSWPSPQKIHEIQNNKYIQYKVGLLQQTKGSVLLRYTFGKEPETNAINSNCLQKLLPM